MKGKFRKFDIRMYCPKESKYVNNHTCGMFIASNGFELIYEKET